MSAAQRDIPLPDEASGHLPTHDPAGRGLDSPNLWPDIAPDTDTLQQQVAARIAAHREKRRRLQSAPAGPVAVERDAPGRRRPTAIAAAVAERYAHSPSYHSFLAEEAERATRQAAAAAEIAARNAAAIADAQQRLLEELDLWNTPAPEQPAREPSIREPAAQPLAARSRPAPASAPALRQPESVLRQPEPAESKAAPAREVSTAGLTVRLYEDLGATAAGHFATNHVPLEPQDSEQAFALDEEIAFRQAPVFEEPAGPPVPIPANLLEFPRQLIAARKARPVLALGPLRETAAPATSQLRIFEVEPQQISPEPAAPSADQEWTSIWLDTPAPAAHHADVRLEPELTLHPGLAPAPAALQVASIGRRVMAASVDAIIIGTGFVVFTSAFVALSGGLPVSAPIPAAVTAVAILLVFALAYELLFFTFSNNTPGMRYARIGLCTFSDDNPTRSAMRKRIFSTFLAAGPLGLGLLWALLDEDHLGWHDRLSKMYQREY